MLTRRQFLKAGLMAGISLYVPWGSTISGALAQMVPLLDPRMLTKYLDLLPIPGVMQPKAPGGDYYEVGMYQISQQLHSQLPTTTVWGYGTSFGTASYPAATFEATRGVPISVKWINNLVDKKGKPLSHPLPVDPTLHWADPNMMGMPMPSFPPFPPGFPEAQSPVPLVTHLHGGETESASDGHPDAWFTPGWKIKGTEWKKRTYYYNNGQEGTTLWYHDHALGITRLNVFMGLAGFYLLRDPAVEPWLNLPSGAYEIPVVIQDRMFYTDGSLYYGNVGVNPDIHPYWQPEFFGDTILVNGKVWPYLDVEPRKYRFRFLNGSNARFYELRLVDAMTEMPGPAFYQIGTDGGFLSAPVMLNDPYDPAAPRLLIAPGERADVIIDFSGYAPGTRFILRNSAKAPFPNGTPADPQTVGQIMKFNVVPLMAPDASSLPTTLVPVPLLNPMGAFKRTLTLNEVMGPAGPIMALLNNTFWDGAITEYPKLGSTEIWEIINLTGDTHPIHLHLVQFQILNRQQFNISQYLKAYGMPMPGYGPPMGGNPDVTPYLQGSPMPPDPNEAGWKDTVRMNPGEVTRIIVRFANQAGGPYPFDATAGGYVWHCHILEHEDNEMMRPYHVMP